MHFLEKSAQKKRRVEQFLEKSAQKKRRVEQFLEKSSQKRGGGNGESSV
jgi:hypothetical protein